LENKGKNIISTHKMELASNLLLLFPEKLFFVKRLLNPNRMRACSISKIWEIKIAANLSGFEMYAPDEKGNKRYYKLIFLFHRYSAGLNRLGLFFRHNRTSPLKGD